MSFWNKPVVAAKIAVAEPISKTKFKAVLENSKINDVKIFWSNTKNKIEFKADLIVANILSSALIVLAPILAEHCKINGKIALSGILESQEDDIKKKYSSWFDFNPSYKKDGWVLISGTKR